jgi:hypothetical protein
MGVSIFHFPLIFAELKIPVIVVLTKYDLLVMEHYRACSDIPSPPDRKMEAKERAFSEITEELKVPFAPVSTQKDYGQLIRSATSLLPLNGCYYRTDVRGIDAGGAGQAVGCSSLIVGPLGRCSQCSAN